jgi:hypothetical protein
VLWLVMWLVAKNFALSSRRVNKTAFAPTYDSLCIHIIAQSVDD